MSLVRLSPFSYTDGRTHDKYPISQEFYTKSQVILMPTSNPNALDGRSNPTSLGTASDEARFTESSKELATWWATHFCCCSTNPVSLLESIAGQ